MLRRQVLSIGGALAASTFVSQSAAGIFVSSYSESAACIQRLYTVDEALRLPAVSALFDESKHSIVQFDFADFELVTGPMRAKDESQMWGISVGLLTDVDQSKTQRQSLHKTLETVTAPTHEIVNVLAVFSCSSQVSAVSLLRQFKPLLASVVPTNGLYGFGVVADEGASIPRMTMLCVTQPIT